jgi:hypothetical protein
MKMSLLRPGACITAACAVSLLTLSALSQPANAGANRDANRGQAEFQPSATPSAVAAPSPDPGIESGETLESAANAEITDATNYANAKGVTLAVAEARLEEQGRLDTLVGQLEDQYPSTYAGANITDSPYTITVFFVGSVPGNAASLAAAADVDVTFGPSVSNSLSELSSASNTATDFLEQNADSGSVSIDIANNEVEVLVEDPGDGKRGQTREAWHSAERAALLASTGGVSTRVTFTKRPSWKAENRSTNGGAEEINGMSYCTAGFPVARSGVYGEMTAGHCPNALTYIPPVGGGSWSMAFEGQHRGQWGDFQWNSPPPSKPVSDRFYVTNETLRTVMGLKVHFSQGQQVCHFGRTSGTSCSDVYRVNVSIVEHDTGITLGHLVAVQGNISQGGDSGGPWWALFNHAAGIHLGIVKFSAGDTYHSVFSRFDQIANAFSGMAYVCGCA